MKWKGRMIMTIIKTSIWFELSWLADTSEEGRWKVAIDYNKRLGEEEEKANQKDSGEQLKQKWQSTFQGQPLSWAHSVDVWVVLLVRCHCPLKRTSTAMLNHRCHSFSHRIFRHCSTVHLSLNGRHSPQRLSQLQPLNRLTLAENQFEWNNK